MPVIKPSTGNGEDSFLAAEHFFSNAIYCRCEFIRIATDVWCFGHANEFAPTVTSVHSVFINPTGTDRNRPGSGTGQASGLAVRFRTPWPLAVRVILLSRFSIRSLPTGFSVGANSFALPRVSGAVAMRMNSHLQQSVLPGCDDGNRPGSGPASFRTS